MDFHLPIVVTDFQNQLNFHQLNDTAFVWFPKISCIEYNLIIDSVMSLSVSQRIKDLNTAQLHWKIIAHTNSYDWISKFIELALAQGLWKVIWLRKATDRSSPKKY